MHYTVIFTKRQLMSYTEAKRRFNRYYSHKDNNKKRGYSTLDNLFGQFCEGYRHLLTETNQLS